MSSGNHIRVPFRELKGANLVVDAIYEGGPPALGVAGDVISKLIPGTGNLGGFRAAGTREDKKVVVLYTSGEDRDWPNRLDPNEGKFVYFGDNKEPGCLLHEKPGNRILQRIFDLLHSEPPTQAAREKIPPFFIFEKFPTPKSKRSVQFRGLAVPGFPGLPAFNDLVAVWKTSGGQRFQNYQAIFTVLDVAEIKCAWLRDLIDGHPMTANAPDVWVDWVRSGRYSPLRAENTTDIRSKDEQLPRAPEEKKMLNTIWRHFQKNPYLFEEFSAQLFKMNDQRVIIDEITRATSDGGRDAIGRYLLGLNKDPVYADFSLEAKCYRPPLFGQKGISVGVRGVSRLISRIRNRQFGVLVTTSVIAPQAYKEVRKDRHPIIFLSGKDITQLLTKNGCNTQKLIEKRLQNEFSSKVR